MKLRVNLDGQVREDVLLKKHLSSNGKWLRLSEALVRLRYEKNPCIPLRVHFETVNIYVCLVSTGESRVERTVNWGASKRLRMYEADIVINAMNPANPESYPAIDYVVKMVSDAAIAVLVQVARQHHGPLESARELMKDSKYYLDEVRQNS